MPDGGRRRDRSRVRASRAQVAPCRACGLWHFPGLACPGSPDPRNAFGIDDRVVMTACVNAQPDGAYVISEPLCWQCGALQGPRVLSGEPERSG